MQNEALRPPKKTVKHKLDEDGGGGNTAKKLKVDRKHKIDFDVDNAKKLKVS